MKKSILNPNAKEFNPTKPLLSVVRWDGGMWALVSVRETWEQGVRALEGEHLTVGQQGVTESGS